MTSRGTVHRSIRIPDRVWVAAQAKAAAEGKSVSAVVRGFLYDWTGTNEHEAEKK